MKKRTKSLTAKLKTSTESGPALKDGWQMFTQRLSAGLAELSFAYCVPTHPEGAAAPGPNNDGKAQRYRFLWQFMTEPEFDHGFSTTYGVLFDEDLGAIGLRSPQSLEAELAEHLGHAEWAKLRANALEASGGSAQYDNWPVLVIALWAEHLSEPLSVVWLAAMAQHAYYVANDDFAFGYLI